MEKQFNGAIESLGSAMRPESRAAGGDFPLARNICCERTEPAMVLSTLARKDSLGENAYCEFGIGVTELDTLRGS